jgi:hypothetical protein
VLFPIPLNDNSPNRLSKFESDRSCGSGRIVVKQEVIPFWGFFLSRGDLSTLR